MLLIAVKDYSETRKEMPAYKDIDLAVQNCEHLRTYFQTKYAISKENTLFLVGPTKQQVDKAMRDIKQVAIEVNAYPEEQRKLLFIVCYSGHGVMTSSNYIMLNTAE